MKSSIQTTASGTVVIVHVKPASRKNLVVCSGKGDPVEVSLTEPAQEHRANKQLVQVLSKVLGVRKSAILILAGMRSRTKTVLIIGMNQNQMVDALRGKAGAL